MSKVAQALAERQKRVEVPEEFKSAVRDAVVAEFVDNGLSAKAARDATEREYDHTARIKVSIYVDDPSEAPRGRWPGRALKPFRLRVDVSYSAFEDEQQTQDRNVVGNVAHALGMECDDSERGALCGTSYWNKNYASLNELSADLRRRLGANGSDIPANVEARTR